MVDVILKSVECNIAWYSTFPFLSAINGSCKSYGIPFLSIWTSGGLRRWDTSTATTTLGPTPWCSSLVPRPRLCPPPLFPQRWWCFVSWAWCPSCWALHSRRNTALRVEARTLLLGLNTEPRRCSQIVQGEAGWALYSCSPFELVGWLVSWLMQSITCIS